MAVIFAGGELDAFVTTGLVFNSSTISRRDPDFSRTAMVVRDEGIIDKVFTPTLEGWLHLNINFNIVGSASQDAVVIRLLDSSTSTSVFQIDADNGVFNAEYWSGALHVELAPAVSFVSGVNHKIDMHWRIANAGGVFEVFLDGVLISSFVGDTLNAGFTTIDRLLFNSPAFANPSSIHDVYFSEVIVADVETIGWHLATLAPDGVGNSTTWTGTNTDVSDIAINDATFISSGTAEEVELFTVSNLSSAAALLDVEAVVVAARSKNAATGPQNVQVSIRTDSLDFFSSNLSGVSAGFTNDQNVWDLNPNTAAKWTPAEINLLEIGVKSKP